MADFAENDLSGARFERVDLTGAEFRAVDLSHASDASLAARTEPVAGPGWPPPKSFEVRQCLLTVLDEEWHHRLFAERDLDALARDARRQAT
jgi:Pentapeptide repeats (8 copies)